GLPWSGRAGPYPWTIRGAPTLTPGPVHAQHGARDDRNRSPSDSLLTRIRLARRPVWQENRGNSYRSDNRPGAPMDSIKVSRVMVVGTGLIGTSIALALR